MRFDLRPILAVTLFTSAVACSDGSGGSGGGGGGASGGTTTTGSATTSGGSCTCNVTIGDDTKKLVCGQSLCVGSTADEERWATCTQSGATLGNNNCVADQWADPKFVSFVCDGQDTCPAGSYCAMRVGPEPRKTECRPLPSDCLHPKDADQLCDCLEKDALTSSICTGATGKLSCRTDVESPELACD